MFNRIWNLVMDYVDGNVGSVNGILFVIFMQKVEIVKGDLNMISVRRDGFFFIYGSDNFFRNSMVI